MSSLFEPSATTENSELFPAASVAVAVMNDPGATPTGRVTSKFASQETSVVTWAFPRYFSPSPYPEGSHNVLEKNSTRKTELGTEFRVPRIVVLAPEGAALVKTGKFCRRFGPRLPSQSSFGVTPSEPKSTPRP